MGLPTLTSLPSHYTRQFLCPQNGMHHLHPPARACMLLTMDEMTKKGTEILQQRSIQAKLDVATPSWWRAYYRANHHRLVDSVEKSFPQQINGAGEGGEHLFKVFHAIKRSPLDDVRIIEGKVVESLPQDA